jgi:NAD(P)-dependent dehydrogenase (short-subunit alcohol dehydrogenase family)
VAAARWTAEDIPDLTGRTGIVTGASTGMGLEIAAQLAAHGAHVVLAARDPGRTEQAARRIVARRPAGTVEVATLDLASLDSIDEFAGSVTARLDVLDILVNNAGIVGGPRRLTADGFEAHLGVNHLGHFALTGRLLPLLLASPGARVVTVSSSLAARSRIDFDDLQSARAYRMMTAYGQSKLANLLFARELDRRARRAGSDLQSAACHPGVVRTTMLVGKSADWGRGRRATERAVRLVQLLTGQPAAAGALPALYQATMPASGGYIGSGRHFRGAPTPVPYPRAALDAAAAERLWRVSAELTGVGYLPLAAPRPG